MKEICKKSNALLLLLAVLFVGFQAVAGLRIPAADMVANVFGFTVSPDDIKNSYANEEDAVRVLIVPGHDPITFGTQFRGLTEAELNVALSRHLYEYFKNDPDFTAITARRPDNGEYTKEFANYFINERDEIRTFMRERRGKMRELLSNGGVDKNVSIHHNFAPSEIALRLYGVNRWANENDVDLTLHVHFNDHSGRPSGEEGEYSGFAVYVPERQYPNADASRELARTIFERFQAIAPISNYPPESSGIVESQELIALGSNASREGAAILMEYGYIYEGALRGRSVRERVLHEYAYQTYQALKEHFENGSSNASNASKTPHNRLKTPQPDEPLDTTLLPYEFTRDLSRAASRGPAEGVLSLQMALMKESVYPPPGRTLSECGLNGFFGPCTERAVKEFQRKYGDEILSPLGLSEPSGYVGASTLRKLNELYGVDAE